MLTKDILKKLNTLDFPQPEVGVCLDPTHRLYHCIDAICPCARISLSVPGYELLLNSTGVEVVRCKTIGTYQGDYLVVVRNVKTDEFGYLTFGYGSCSGCDAYERCSTLEDFLALRDDLSSNTHWEDTPQKLAQWMKDRDWEVQPLGTTTELRGFVFKAIEFLEETERV